MHYTVQMNRESYNKIASEFSGTRNFVWKDIEYLMKFLNENDDVLDLGCGNGRILKIPNSKFQIPRYVGVDFSEKLIDEAKKSFPEYRFIVGDVLTLDKRIEKKFDAVIMIAVLNHFPKDLHNQAIEQIKKALKPGGKLLMINWNLWNIQRKKSVWRNIWKFKNVMTTWRSGNKSAPLFYYAFTKGELKKLLEKNGFEVIENFYSKKAEKTNMFVAENILTVAEMSRNELN